MCSARDERERLHQRSHSGSQRHSGERLTFQFSCRDVAGGSRVSAGLFVGGSAGWGLGSFCCMASLLQLFCVVLRCSGPCGEFGLWAGLGSALLCLRGGGELGALASLPLYYVGQTSTTQFKCQLDSTVFPDMHIICLVILQHIKNQGHFVTPL